MGKIIKYSQKKYVIINGVMDYMDHESVYEFKFTSELSIEHKL